MIMENKKFLKENSTVQNINNYILLRIKKDIEKDYNNKQLKK